MKLMKVSTLEEALKKLSCHTVMNIHLKSPNNVDPWEDQQLMHTIHLCDMHNIPIATNLASAEVLILGLQRGDLDWREMIKPRRGLNKQ